MKIFILNIVVIFMILFIITTINYFYCEIFEYKNRKLWRKFIKDHKKFQLGGEIDGYKLFVSDDDKYHIIIYANNTCSIHTRDCKCILSNFDKIMSKKMAKLLTENN